MPKPICGSSIHYACLGHSPFSKAELPGTAVKLIAVVLALIMLIGCGTCYGGGATLYGHYFLGACGGFLAIAGITQIVGLIRGSDPSSLKKRSLLPKLTPKQLQAIEQDQKILLEAKRAGEIVSRSLANIDYANAVQVDSGICLRLPDEILAHITQFLEGHWTALSQWIQTCKKIHHHIAPLYKLKIDQWCRDSSTKSYFTRLISEANKSAYGNCEVLMPHFSEEKRQLIPVIYEVRDQSDKFPTSDYYSDEMLELLPKFEQLNTPLLMGQDAGYRLMFLIRINAKQGDKIASHIVIFFQRYSNDVGNWRIKSFPELTNIDSNPQLMASVLSGNEVQEARHPLSPSQYYTLWYPSDKV